MVNDKALEAAAALVVLARYNIPVDVQELLVSGDPMRVIRPGALAAALTAAKEVGEPAAWLHPTANWANVDKSFVAMHCLKDGPQPIALYTRPLPSPPASQGGEE